MKEVIAVFDIGKTNKKVLLFDEDMQLVFQHEQKFPVCADEDGFECDDIDRITDWIKVELTNLTEAGEYNLKAVNFSTYGASLMFLDENGKRLTPVYNYLKEVPESIATTLFDQNGGKDEFCRRTASPALGLLLNSGIQALWLKQEKPEVFAKSRSILHFPQYLTYALSGQVVSEPTSIGCHTFMWDFDKMAYHPWLKDNGIELPQPLTNDQVFDASIGDKKILVGTGIHDSSSSLVPYLKGSEEPFILVSTGTWCITMNPFNSEPLTAEQLEQDCLCFLSPDQQQVKSSRLFMGHFHEVWAAKLAEHFKTDENHFRYVKCDEELIDSLNDRFKNESLFFPTGKKSFDDGLKLVGLTQFSNYEEAYTKLMIDLTALCITSIHLVIPENDETRKLYISGGFARNPIFIHLLNQHFVQKQIVTSEIDNASALGAALVVADRVGFRTTTKLTKN
ncbi:FGGY-family carbohydrate kinase [Mangrovibacterium lignilyticum]|uniref:FGGY-family carbohydrate kinase n=1 Tax=Mangrovibacterium lignilyticum TaxID=2668052 RepID=UPI0013D6F3DE|nr:FGGY family carbohydrate kinase [Mangrovibacterium lignilyticum]